LGNCEYNQGYLGLKNLIYHMDQGEEDKLAAFVSEESRMLEELIDEVDVVVSDRSDLEGLAPEKFHDLGHDEDRILELLGSKGVSTAVCLGYRRLFSGFFLQEVECEMYNLHPSILPGFKGLDVYERVIERGVKISGATLHKISEEMDEGEIIDQVSYRLPEDVSVSELRDFAAEYELELVRENLLDK
jgi:folate-dependent phosphoribosylglycinamide formyltransferase PurN